MNRTQSGSRVRRPVPNFNVEKNRSPIPGLPSCNGFAKPTSGFVALTFDDGPNPQVTEPLLDYLLEHDIWTSFFLVGERAAANKSTVAALHKAGMVIGNHSWSHPALGELTGEAVREQVRKAHHEISSIIGEPVRVLRAPYNQLSDQTGSAVALFEEMQSLGYSHHCGFGPVMPDWEDRSADDLIGHLRATVPKRWGHANFDHKWILAHDYYGSFDRMRAILDWLRGEVGYFSLRFTGVISSV